MKNRGWKVALIVAALWAGLPAAAFPGSPPVPGPREKCAVCGMFVARHPNWTTSISLSDGSRRYFDGVKDMLTLYLSPEKYGIVGGRSSIRDIWVKDYYTLESIDGRKAFYVEGSDVLGPMGKELVAFARQKDAREFMRDHRGKRLYPFKELNDQILQRLEK